MNDPRKKLEESVQNCFDRMLEEKATKSEEAMKGLCDNLNRLFDWVISEASNFPEPHRTSITKDFNRLQKRIQKIRPEPATTD